MDHPGDHSPAHPSKTLEKMEKHKKESGGEPRAKESRRKGLPNHLHQGRLAPHLPGGQSCYPPSYEEGLSWFPGLHMPTWIP